CTIAPTMTMTATIATVWLTLALTRLPFFTEDSIRSFVVSRGDHGTRPALGARFPDPSEGLTERKRSDATEKTSGITRLTTRGATKPLDPGGSRRGADRRDVLRSRRHSHRGRPALLDCPILAVPRSARPVHPGGDRASPGGGLRAASHNGSRASYTQPAHAHRHRGVATGAGGLTERVTGDFRGRAFPDYTGFGRTCCQPGRLKPSCSLLFSSSREGIHNSARGGSRARSTRRVVSRGSAAWRW